ncbi:IS30 family transposase [Pseudogemmatithrix spongiicola]|uniref:IS30 family transposase n=1 Tax=Pseudogemmatithrix spongiicola TaxID=3062599 RepID=A0AA49Q9K8_9BACT|nr:IS30 family transposase [Gemmatimonadaceae bacterium]MCW5827324.1 IS30 family transposase [Gemmatimonadaceae bacterium]WKW13549.1 IS30 family transposase [Gemmatimonadaceae bacterium 'strain 138']WKW16455.1 IS30 family transposase [Gemmatimonadaceae bacterium 'strain 318']
MTYTQITHEERYAISALRKLGYSCAAIARELGRAPSTISREVRRNAWRTDGRTYWVDRAQSYTNERRRASRRNARITAEEWAFVEHWIREDWSPEQIVGFHARFGIRTPSHESIYRHIHADRERGGTLYTHLRVMTKNLRKRYGTYDSRGRLAGKRHISTRPAGAENRSRFGHWEGDTVMGSTTDTACILTLVERKSGFIAIGQLDSRQAPETNARLRQLIEAQPRPVRTLTLDNGTEFHSYEKLEAVVDAKCYFATPHHSWERGSNENANGLIRQYLPKRRSMKGLTQRDCQRIADKLNRRPRKRLGFKTPAEVYAA